MVSLICWKVRDLFETSVGRRTLTTALLVEGEVPYVGEGTGTEEASLEHKDPASEGEGMGPPPDHFDDMDDCELMRYDEMYHLSQMS